MLALCAHFDHFKARKISHHPAISDLKIRFGEWNILLLNSLATESHRLEYRLATKPLFKADNANADRRWLQGAWQSLLVNDARHLRIGPCWSAFASRFTNMCHVPAARSCRQVVGLRVGLYEAHYNSTSCNHPRGLGAFLELLISRLSTGAEEQLYLLWLSVCEALEPSTASNSAFTPQVVAYTETFGINLPSLQLRHQ